MLIIIAKVASASIDDAPPFIMELKKMQAVLDAKVAPQATMD